MYATVVSIISFIVSVILAIGLAKLYRKIDMPDWTVGFQYAYPIITLVLGFGKGFIVGLISFVIGLMAISVLCYFFQALGMSKWWPLALIAGIILLAIGIAQSLFGTSIWLIVGIILILMYGYAHIISSIRLAEKFDKGIMYKILLIILPGIFQPVLGFEKN